MQKKKKGIKKLYLKKKIIIKNINFRKTVEYNALNIRTYFLIKKCRLMCQISDIFASPRVVASKLDVDFPLFSRVDCMSKQFCHPL